MAMEIDTVSAVEDISRRIGISDSDMKPAIETELGSILRIHRIEPEDLLFKWESYCMKMGAETQMDLKTVRNFKKDLNDILERESRDKAQSRQNERRAGPTATPRAAMNKSDVFGMLDDLATPSMASSGKRKANFATPAIKAHKSQSMSSPSDFRTVNGTNGVTSINGSTPTTFADRKDAGAIVESLNHHIEIPTSHSELPAEPRLRPKANSEMAKFAYKTMSMKLSEGSEILDDRIEEYASLIAQHHKLDEMEFGNPASRSSDEIVAVGRIASDSHEGRLNTSSLLLETSRRLGAGRRVVLKIDELQDYHFFPGQIVALRGSNASGSYFAAREILEPPPQNIVSSRISELDIINDRIESADGTTRSLVTLIAAGPYTTELDLDFSPLHTLLASAEEIQADALVLCGPFIDTEHPLVRSGDFDLPSNYSADPDRASVNNLFKAHISSALSKLAQSLPSISIILCPSIRDVVSKHNAWPQDRLNRKELALPRQVSLVTNPMLLSLNEILFGISTQDVLDQIRSSEITAGKPRQAHILERGCRQIIEQRHFFPVFPPLEPKRSDSEGDAYTYTTSGASLDVSYFKLGEFLGAKPDVLVTPSMLPSFVKVVNNVISINPGSLSKRRGPGTYARMIINPLVVSDEERDKAEEVDHRLHERCRVDIVKI